MRTLEPLLSVEQKLSLTAGADMWKTTALPHAGISEVRFADGPMGLTGGRVDERDVALLTPSGVAIGASWDRDLVRRIGELVGDEAIRIGVQAVLGPNLNLPRSPLAGRAFELFSEDPQLTAELGCQWIHGIQARGVAAVAKHVVCNDSETDRRNMNSVVDESALREVYLWPFEYAARHGVWGMLTAYNRLNGTRCAEHRLVLRDWLKVELEWDGLITSDWFGTHDGSGSLSAGLDLEMPGPARHMGTKLAQRLADGTLSHADLDDANARMRLLSERVSRPADYDGDQQAIANRLSLLEEAAAAGFVLLSNKDQMLPLDTTKHGRLAIIGPNAAVPCYQGGTFAKVSLSPEVPQPLEVIEQYFSDAGWEVDHAQGVLPNYRLPPLTSINPRTASDTPGLDVAFFDSLTSTEAIHREVRNTTSLVWFKEMPGIESLLDIQGEARVEASAVFTASHSGIYRFCVGGTGAASLRINDDECLSYDGLAVSGDIMGKLMQSQYDHVDRFIAAGDTVTLKFTLRFGASIAHGLWFGCLPPVEPDLLQRAVELASNADAVVLMVGETADAGLESVDRDTTCLPGGQIELIEQVCAANPKTVVVVNAAHAIDTECLRQAAAVLMVWYPGQQFAPALAKVLSGELEPGGRLPVTFARHEHDYPAWSLRPNAQGDLHYLERDAIGYRHFDATDIAPAYCFGHGLSYGNFCYAEAQIIGDHVDELMLEVTVNNDAVRASKEIVQVYLKGPDRQIRLAGFANIWLEAGQALPVRVNIERHQFERWNTNGWKLIPGEYRLLVGRSVNDIRIQATLVLSQGGDLHISS
jgi:beta-glucosidase